MRKIKARIDNIEVEVEEGTSILEAAEKVQVKIPTLCKHPDLCATAACGICVVKVSGRPNLIRSCCTPLDEGMEITTRDPELVEVRRNVIELILSKHPNECLTCIRNGNCELQKLAADFGIRREEYASIVPDLPKDDSTKSIVLDPRKCINCGRCVEVCQNQQSVWALSFLNRGISTQIAAAGGIPLAESPCIKCGQCSAHCPTGAITEYDDTLSVWSAINDKSKHCVVQIAPAVRVAIGEAFGLPSGTLTTGKLYAALRRIGFDAVFDTNFSADVTIMEEASEFVDRFINKSGPLPLITSCCPSWVDFMEKYHYDMIPYFSSCKSPQGMLGALAKTYYASKKGIRPEDMVVVSIMPCTAKKYEALRPELSQNGRQDTDFVLTTKELGKMIKSAGIDFNSLEPEAPDSPFGEYTGAGTIFGASGGVAEAAVRTAYEFATGEVLQNVDIKEMRGTTNRCKDVEIDIKGTKVVVRVVSTLKEAEKSIKEIKEGKAQFQMLEVMACPGGCINGGGQPASFNDSKIKQERAEGLYKEDEQLPIRKSHMNPSVQKLYQEFLEHPNSHKAHEILHTVYTDRFAGSYKDIK